MFFQVFFCMFDQIIFGVYVFGWELWQEVFIKMYSYVIVFGDFNGVGKGFWDVGKQFVYFFFVMYILLW